MRNALLRILAVYETDSRVQFGSLLVVTALAIALRFYKIGEWSFWIDEIYTVRDAFNHDTINVADVYRIKPNVDYGFSFISISYTLVRLALQSFGISEWSARLFPALIGALTVPALFLAVRKVLGGLVAVLASLFLALSPWHIQLSQNARYYTAFIFFSMLALLAFYWSVEQNKLRYMVLAIVLLWLAILERIHALFFLPVVASYLILLAFLPFGKKPAGLTPRTAALFLAVPVGLFLLYEALYRFVLDRQTFLSVFFSSKFLGLITAQPTWLLTGMLTDLGLPLAFLAAVGGFFLLWQRRRIGLLLVLGALVPVMILMGLSLFFQTSVHYAILSLPCWLILAGVGVKELAERVDRTWSVLLMAGVLATIALLFLRDRVIRDVEFFYSPSLELGVLVSAAFMAGAFSALLTLWLSHMLLFEQERLQLPDWLRRGVVAAERVLKRVGPQASAGVWIFVLLPLLLLHPLFADRMYYAFQHGYRDNNWKGALALVRSQRRPGDLVVSAVPPVSSFYLGEQTLSITQVDVEQVVQSGQRVWVLQEYGVQLAKGFEFESWLETNCEELGAYDRYVRGRTWKMRVKLCSSQTAFLGPAHIGP